MNRKEITIVGLALISMTVIIIGFILTFLGYLDLGGNFVIVGTILLIAAGISALSGVLFAQKKKDEETAEHIKELEAKLEPKD